MSKLAIFIIDREQAEELMAKVADLSAAVSALTTQVNDAVALLNAPVADDPAVQALVDQVNTAAAQLQSAVSAFKAAHP